MKFINSITLSISALLLSSALARPVLSGIPSYPDSEPTAVSTGASDVSGHGELERRAQNGNGNKKLMNKGNGNKRPMKKVNGQRKVIKRIRKVHGDGKVGMKKIKKVRKIIKTIRNLNGRNPLNGKRGGNGLLN